MRSLANDAPPAPAPTENCPPSAIAALTFAVGPLSSAPFRYNDMLAPSHDATHRPAVVGFVVLFWTVPPEPAWRSWFVRWIIDGRPAPPYATHIWFAPMVTWSAQIARE